MKKRLSFFFVALVLFFLYSGGKKVFLEVRSMVKGLQTEEILEDDVIAAIVETEKNEEKNIEGVNVPFYWKGGIPAENDDYLKGYVPSIKGFNEYISVKGSIIYGSSLKAINFPNYESVLPLLENTNTIYVEGMRSEHEYFAWDEERCATLDNSDLGYKIFICDNWVNWMGVENETPMFVLTDCNINNQEGKCVFLDYANIYFQEKKMTESRCLSLEAPDFCELEEYLKLIKFK